MIILIAWSDCLALVVTLETCSDQLSSASNWTPRTFMDCFDRTFTPFIDIVMFGIVVLENKHNSVLDLLTYSPEFFSQLAISYILTLKLLVG